MTRLKKLGQEYWLDESGATAIEYALIAAVVGIAIIGGASSIGKTPIRYGMVFPMRSRKLVTKYNSDLLP